MEFSSLIDVSSFFIGVLINLLLIALICFYFKRKFDNIEMAQSEQAKIIYNLIESRQTQERIQPEANSELSFFNPNDLQKLESKEVMVSDLDKLDTESIEDHSDDDDDDDDDDSMATQTESELEETNTIIDQASIEVNEPGLDDIKTVELLETEPNDDENVEEETIIIEKTDDSSENTMTNEYERMTVKELREVLLDKGYHVKSNMKKVDMLELLQNPIENEVELDASTEPVIELDE
jgi:hypothetical protein